MLSEAINTARLVLPLLSEHPHPLFLCMQAGADGTAAEGDADMAEEPAAQLEALRNLAAHSQAQFSERVASGATAGVSGDNGVLHYW